MSNTWDESRLALRQFLQENIEPLEGIIRSYVVRTGLAQGEAVQGTAIDILNEASVEALAHLENFHTVRQPRAWFLGIAANVIKRRCTTIARGRRKEFPIGILKPEHETESESDFFDQITQLAYAGPEQEFEAHEQVTEMLALVSPDDRYVLQLAFVQDLDTHSLALALHVSPGTARMRLHRALNRLRAAWHKQEKREREYYA